MSFLTCIPPNLLSLSLLRPCLCLFIRPSWHNFFPFLSFLWSSLLSFRSLTCIRLSYLPFYPLLPLIPLHVFPLCLLILLPLLSSFFPPPFVAHLLLYPYLIYVILISCLDLRLPSLSLDLPSSPLVPFLLPLSSPNYYYTSFSYLPYLLLYYPPSSPPSLFSLPPSFHSPLNLSPPLAERRQLAFLLIVNSWVYLRDGRAKGDEGDAGGGGCWREEGVIGGDVRGGCWKR